MLALARLLALSAKHDKRKIGKELRIEKLERHTERRRPIAREEEWGEKRESSR